MRSIAIHRRIEHTSWARLALAGLLILVGLGLVASDRLQAAEQKYWELSPYDIQLHLAVDTAECPQPGLAEQLARRIQQRVEAVLSPLWVLEVKVSAGRERYQLLSQGTPPAWDEVPEAQQSADKWMVLSVVAVPEGYRLRCRELDCYLHQWGPELQRTVRQRGMLDEACFRLLCDAFAPLATIRSLPDNDAQVELHFKGSDLPVQATDSLLQRPGEVYKPLLRRTDRTGELLTDGILEVPWTYLILDQPQDDQWTADVHSGSRTPFGMRRRGRTEQLAIAMRGPQHSSKVRFYSRYDKTQGLAGYEVFTRGTDDEESHLLAMTDLDGTVTVEPGNTPITTLLLRSDGALLAKVPMVPGVVDVVEVPIADDAARMRAQARLVEVREQLIDLVARRNILMARVRAELEEGNLKEAQEMMDQLNALPGRSRLNQDITSAKEAHESADPKIQARIDQMFDDTLALLGRFLDPRQISELENKINQAQRGPPPDSSESSG